TSAVITTPGTGNTLSSKSLLVSGSCPLGVGLLTVVLLLDDTPAGSAVCDANNNFALPVVLTPGEHTLVAQTHNTTLGQGPESEPVTVSYVASGADSTEP